MYVQVRHEPDYTDLQVFVLGEQLGRDEEGTFLLPGRLACALKANELPEGVCFKLSAPLKSGLQFYREDQVRFGRELQQKGLQVKVTSSYKKVEWDGLFHLQATMEARRTIILRSEQYTLEEYEEDESHFHVSFSFQQEEKADHDLEEVIESIFYRVCWVEEKGNEQLLFGGS